MSKLGGGFCSLGFVNQHASIYENFAIYMWVSHFSQWIVLFRKTKPMMT